LLNKSPRRGLMHLTKGVLWGGGGGG